MTAVTCAACGRPIPDKYRLTAVEGMHPGCHRKTHGRPARNGWDVQS